MADQKISELTALTGGNAADDDVLAIVDTSATETKKITRSELFTDTPTVLVGTTGTDPNNATTSGGAGLAIRSDGRILNGVYQDFTADFNRIGNDGEIIRLSKDGSTVGSISTLNGMLAIGNDNVFLNIDGGSGDYIYPMSSASGGASDGNVTLGFSSRRFKDLYLSGGVYLGGTGSANKLDDYEEGTWTPSLNSGTFSAVGATYTKIGRLVMLTLDGTVGTGGGSQITNIPFTTGVTTATALYTSGQNFSSGRTVPIVIVGGDSTILYFRDIGDNVAFAAMPLTAGASITFNITYYVN